MRRNLAPPEPDEAPARRAARLATPPRSGLGLETGRTRWIIAPLTALLGAMLGSGCGGDASAPGTGEVEVDLVVQLGEEDGPGMIADLVNVTLLSDGRYAVWDMRIPAEVRFFGAAGDYLGAFGRPGEGPGEFQRPVFQWLDPSGDSLFVIDIGQGRMSVLSPDGEVLYETRPAGVGQPWKLWFLPDGRIIANASALSPDGDPTPLRLVGRNGEELAAFGAPSATGAPQGHRRNVHVSPDGTLWIVPQHEYRLERWVPVPPEEGHYVLDTIFEPGTAEVDPVEELTLFPDTERDGPPSALVVGVWKEPGGPVWVALWVPRPDWPARLERWQRVLDADYYANHALHRTRLEAFDPETGEFLGATEVDAAWVGFVGDGQAYSYETNEIGIPFVNLWRVRLR